MPNRERQSRPSDHHLEISSHPKALGISEDRCLALTKKGTRCRLTPTKGNFFCHHHQGWISAVLPSNPQNKILFRLFLISAATIGIGSFSMWVAELGSFNFDRVHAFWGAYFMAMLAHSFFERVNPLRSFLAGPILLISFLVMSFSPKGIETNLKWLVFPIVCPIWFIWKYELGFWFSVGVVGIGCLISLIFSMILVNKRLSHLRSLHKGCAQREE